jgi:hypothetical protein
VGMTMSEHGRPTPHEVPPAARGAILGTDRMAQLSDIRKT